MVAQNTFLLVFGTTFATVHDLALVISFAFPQIGVVLVVEASHEHVAVRASKSRNRAFAFVVVPHRYVPHHEMGAADRAAM